MGQHRPHSHQIYAKVDKVKRTIATENVEVLLNTFSIRNNPNTSCVNVATTFEIKAGKSTNMHLSTDFIVIIVKKVDYQRIYISGVLDVSVFIAAQTGTALEHTSGDDLRLAQQRVYQLSCKAKHYEHKVIVHLCIHNENLENRIGALKVKKQIVLQGVTGTDSQVRGNCTGKEQEEIKTSRNTYVVPMASITDSLSARIEIIRKGIFVVLI